MIVFNKDAIVVAFIAVILFIPIGLLWMFGIINEHDIFLPGS